MKKRILPLALCLALLLALIPAAGAQQAGEEEMAQVLSALDIMTGDENGDLMLERRVTRAEFTKLVVAASSMGKSVGSSTTVSPYPDVPHSHWAAPYVEAAVAAGWVKGYLDGSFHPDEDITLVMGVTMAVRLLGYSDGDFSTGVWGAGQMTLYHNLDLDEGISLTRDEAMTRRDAMCLFYNLLTAQTKTGQVYLTTLGHRLTAAGEIDRVALVNAAMKGPVVLEEGWEERIGFNVDTAKVYRGGRASSLSALQTGDVIYWSRSMRTLWAYTGKVTGVYQGASPSASSPAAVTVAGKTYSIETADAAYALSNLGSFQTGDTVTLLLGRDGGVAAVREGGALPGTLYGVAAAVADGAYTDRNGHSYTARTLTLTATDGGRYAYPVEDGEDWEPGDLVQVSAGAEGAQVRKLKGSSAAGRVDAAGTRLGDTPLAADVEILDANENGEAIRLYPGRLAGAVLEEEDVRFCRKNAQGEIDLLILDDFSGDLYAYGVLTECQETPPALSLAVPLTGVYRYDVGGQSYSTVTQDMVWNLSVGPARIEGNVMAPSRIRNLTEVKLSGADALGATLADGSVFPMADGAAVYVYAEGSYRLSSLERVREGYSLSGWYDAEVGDGGRIRVIVAR